MDFKIINSMETGKTGNSIQFVDFCQKMKTLIWESMEDGKFPDESALDEIALKLWDKFLKK